MSFADIAEDLSIGLMIHTELRKGRFGLFFDPLFIRTEDTAELGAAQVDITSDTAVVAASAFYRVVDVTLGEREDGRRNVFAVEPMVGARLTHLRLELEPERLRETEESETWVDPIIGTRIRADRGARWTLLAEGDVGGFGIGSDLTRNAQAYLGYRTSVAGVPTSLAAGYRALSWDYEDGGFKWDVIQHGPLVGAASASDRRPPRRGRAGCCGGALRRLCRAAIGRRCQDRDGPPDGWDLHHGRRSATAGGACRPHRDRLALLDRPPRGDERAVSGVCRGHGLPDDRRARSRPKGSS